MKKNKLFFASALSVSLLGVAAISSAILASSDVSDSVNTSTPEATVTQPVDTTPAGDVIVIPQRAIDAIDVGVTGGATVGASFDIPKGYGHVKLRIKNYSSYPVKVSLSHIESNKEYITGLKIPAHGEVTWRSTDKGYSGGLRSGSYTLQWRGSDYKVDGHVWGVIASERGGL
ncbi:hypothetical protein [Paenibacillus kribbensis]|uniref:hypothetical protein n=1 Tax=Paenibacillus kribbensis TaxID=172713 RepID=UPI000838E4F4|nr:hypothetical protein [Paenibacillus kribbensis]